MTKKELVKLLEKYDDNIDIVIAGYEHGVSSVQGAKPILVYKNVNTFDYYGEHEPVDINDPKELKSELVLYLLSSRDLSSYFVTNQIEKGDILKYGV
jgi:hypothetical protein